jgi:tRNA (pseudouridine54-N1)-methyltransferase
MRHFIYFSSKAATSGKALSGDLMKAGRIDIALHVIISSFFLSNSFREDVKLHLIFYGPPDPPKHIEMQITEDLEISKKDLGNLIKKLLYKYQKGKKTEIFPKCFIEKKSFLKVIEELEKENEIFILDKKGEDIRRIDIPKNCVFIIGDHEGLPKKEIRRLRKTIKTISIGPKVYFASQTVSIINNELDRRSI